MITLVLGGTRSGKSEIAEAIACGLPQPVLYLATASVGDDAAFAARVSTHRDRRPTMWETCEVQGEGLVAALRGRPAVTALIDSLGSWVAGHGDSAVDDDALIAALVERSGPSVLVSEEVGLGVHPPTAVGVRFADGLGELNRAVAEVADRVLLVVAGRALPLPRFES